MAHIRPLRRSDRSVPAIAIPTETELKLALDPAAVPALLRHPALRPLRCGRARTAPMHSVYFDTPDGRLERADVALRVRRTGRCWVQTLKGPRQAGAGLHERPEYEWAVPGPDVDMTRLATTPWKKLSAKAAKDGGFVPICTTDFERRTIPLEFPDGTTAQLCVDLGVIGAVCNGRTRRVSIAEIEIELGSGDTANLFRLALALCTDLPLTVMTETKAARGYALRRGLARAVVAPEHASAVALAADATTAEALAAVARQCLHQIAANAPGLVADDDPEWIHQMRVGTRRLRSCLSLVARIGAAAATEPVAAEVKWLATVLGRARDWDVFVTQTLPPLAAWFAGDPIAAPGIGRLRSRATARRRSARREARAAVVSPRFQRLLLAIGLVCATPWFGAPPDAVDDAADAADAADAPLRPAAEFAVKLLARRHRKLVRLASGLMHASVGERHAARIAAKRLRYVAEFFAPLFPGKRTRSYVAALEDVQDALGQLNDAVTAASLAGELARPGDDAAAGAVRGWAAAHAAGIEPRLADVWRRFSAAKPFWRSP
jgi:triphosphatase